MSKEASKIRTWWLIVAAVPAFLLGALLFRGCKGTAQDCPTINIDSLQTAWAETFPKDTIILPGRQDTILKSRIVNLKDTAEVNRLRRELVENERYATAQRESLEKALGEYKAKERDEAGLAAWNMMFRVNTWKDSVITPTYRHDWTIEAEGKILSYRFGIEPIIPPCPMCEELPVIRRHRIGAFAGLQTNAGIWRQVYGATYRYRWLQINAGYLPKSAGLSAGLQITVGADIGLFK